MLLKIDAIMAAEMEKPSMVRNVLPMVTTHCPVCSHKDCTNQRCPLMKAKFLGEYVTVVDFANSQRERGERVKLDMEESVKPHSLPETIHTTDTGEWQQMPLL